MGCCDGEVVDVDAEDDLLGFWAQLVEETWVKRGSDVAIND